MTPRVTVVTPTWNRVAVLGQAMESVRAQTVQDYEHVVVDDGSTDGTEAFVRERYGDDPRVRYLRQEHCGVSAARNLGIREARAPWLALLDSDDVWRPTCLETQLRHAAARPDADLVVGDCDCVGKRSAGELTYMSFPRWLPPDTIENLCRGAWAQPTGMLVRTDVAREIPFDETLARVEDTDFLFRYVLSGRKMVLHRDVVGVYRMETQTGAAKRLCESLPEIQFEAAIVKERYIPHCELCRQSFAEWSRLTARLLAKAGRRRESRIHYWRWWVRKPFDRKALKGLLRSLVPWR
jgi:glycosyltransferase involved in cell wall biosynthesis